MCRKMAFASRAEAKQIMRAAKRRQDAVSAPMTARSAYRCEKCRSWHLTSLTKAEQRRKGLA